MTNKGIVISIGGISCSGKTTLTNRLLEELGKNHNNHLIHVQHISQDDFYDESKELEDWDSPEAIRMDDFIQEIQNRKNNPHKFCQSTTKNDEKGLTQIYVILVDGFLLYYDDRIMEEFDLMFLLDLDYESAKERRAQRCDRIPPDPPNYFDEIVWPNFQKYTDSSNQKIHKISGKQSYSQIFEQVRDKIYSFLFFSFFFFFFFFFFFCF